MTKIRITQRVEFGERVVMPGEVVEVDELIADDLIANDSAIEWGDNVLPVAFDEEIEQPVKRTRKVKDGR